MQPGAVFTCFFPHPEPGNGKVLENLRVYLNFFEKSSKSFSHRAFWMGGDAGNAMFR